MDYRFLPEVVSGGAAELRRAQKVHEAIWAWANTTAVRILNRPASMVSNASKPFQSQVLHGLGFHVPATLVSDDPALVREFVVEHERVIYKSVSSNRSIVKLLGREDFGRLEDVRTCPTQFQEHISGHDLRIHTVGGHWVGTTIRTEAVDYRYASRFGKEVEMEAAEGFEELGAQCVRSARKLGLGLAGFDFRVTEDGRAYCLEVNPMPVFEYYESRTEQEIGRLVARHLAGED
jgi:glutathione synthase/RimK-type ligase-like ATP-grasp enzyme